MALEFGFGSLTCQKYPGDPRSDVDLYREALALAEEAERLGFDAVWTSEHHFFDDSYSPSVLCLCAAIAARTSRIGIGTGVALAPLYEAVRLAEDAATVDLLSGGRFILGISLGWREEEFEGLRIPLRDRRQRFEDTVATLRQAWSDGLVTGGSALSYPGVSVTPKPARPGGPPIWIGATAEVAVRRAARLGDGFLASWSTLESFAEQVRWLREELERVGRDPARYRFGIVLPTFAWEGRDGWERAREHLHYYAWKYDDMAEARGRTPPPGAPPPLTRAREEELRRFALVGSPDEVAERILRFAEAAGGDLHFSAELVWPGLDPAVVREATAVFAERVMATLGDRAEHSRRPRATGRDLT